MKLGTHVAAIVPVLCVATAWAQDIVPGGNVGVPVNPAWSYYTYPNAYHHSSTPLEGYGRGIAAVIRSQGDYNLSSSAGALDLSEARRREIENQKLWTKTYFEIRDINRQAFEAEQKRLRATPAEWIRFAEAGRPSRLSPSELDTVTGEIHWPILLTAPAYSTHRREVQKAFADRAYHGVLGAETFLRVLQLTDDMLSELKSRIRLLPADNYVTAKQFLQSLAFEAGQPAG